MCVYIFFLTYLQGGKCKAYYSNSINTATKRVFILFKISILRKLVYLFSTDALNESKVKTFYDFGVKSSGKQAKKFG